MDRIYHYTSNRNWISINQSGMLVPKSNPYGRNIELAVEIEVKTSPRVREVITSDSYLVGIPESSIDAWVECGLMEHLVKHTSKEMVLAVPILLEEGAFVREYKYASPKYMIESAGRDLFKEFLEGEISSRAFVHSEFWLNYIESTIRLEEYDGQFEVPEIWLPQRTPVNLIDRV